MKTKNSFALVFVLGILSTSTSYTGDPPLINIKDVAPSILVEMRYATPHNFVGKPLYETNDCVLTEPAARRIARVEKNLKKKGLGLKVWDCYRPLSVQKRLWSAVPDARYVANPKTGSRHNRGASVDLTLVDRNGEELLMPTGFDEFSIKAHRDHMNLPEEAIRNREILRASMEAEGFTGIQTEWWHFDSPEWSQYALRDDPVGSSKLQQDLPAKADSTLHDHIGQLVLVLLKDWKATTGQLRRYQRKGSAWKEAGSPWEISLGKKGSAWGRGAQCPQEGPQKKEGDLKTPLGLFKIGQAYGYAARPPRGTTWPYLPLSASWVCVDDPRSTHYNQIFSVKNISEKDWKTAEKMRRKDNLYKWVINIEQNWPDVAKARGSCIFLHVWRRAQSPTQGCTAMEEKHMVELLKWLNPSAHPHILQLTRVDYQRLKKSWRLP